MSDHSNHLLTLSVFLVLILHFVKVTVSQMNCVAPPPTTLTTPTGDITQPPFPDPIWNGTNCGDFFWIIQAPGPCDTITLTIDSYALLTGLDRLEVFDGNYPGGTNLGIYSGILQPTAPVKPVLTSTGNVMTVWFNTTNYPGSSINFFSHYQINSIPCPSPTPVPPVPVNSTILITIPVKLKLIKMFVVKTGPIFFFTAKFLSTVWCLASVCYLALCLSTFLNENQEIPNRHGKSGYYFNKSWTSLAEIVNS